MSPTTSDRERLRRLGQADLGAWVEVATGEQLWTVQRQISTALSKPRAQVAVPSCNASGKTWLAARLALAFYDAYQPGVECDICGGPCKGSKVITLSSKWEHLKDNLWGELRRAFPRIMEAGIGIDGILPPADLRLHHTPEHFIMGQSAQSEESIQGYHAGHKLIIGDEATSVSEEVSKGLTSLMASGDVRLLAIFNPTTPDTWAAAQARSPLTETIKITAFDTPHFTGEHVPEGANLINPGFLEKLKLEGMGPGTYEWTTRVCAEFWTLGEDKLIAEPWYDKALLVPAVVGVRALGIDIASYGTAESVIALRDGNSLAEVLAFPAGRTDHFFQGPVTEAVMKYAPQYVIYDADGVGAGAVGYADALYRHLPPGAQVIGFRGALKINDAYTNARSAWYWNLRRQLEAEMLNIDVSDDKLRTQLTDILYSIVNGAIRVETKEEMKKRGVASPDRGDAAMYAFAFSMDLPEPIVTPDPQWVDENVDVIDHGERAMWEREKDRYGGSSEVHPVLDVMDF